MASTYRNLIREDMAALGLIGRHDPAVIEAWMRLEHSTLDALPRADFRAEVRIASDCADYSTPEENRALAESYGAQGGRVSYDDRIRILPCGCHYDVRTGVATDLCAFHTQQVALAARVEDE